MQTDGTAPPLNLDELFGADDFEDNYDVPELPPPLDLEAIGGARSPPRQHERTQPAASRDISNGSPTAVNRPSEGEATPTAALGEGGEASGSEPKKAKAPRKIRTYEKYDENMLASSKGLHRLLGMAKKLKLRKPHKENTRHNLTKILEVYQIWGHTLYPSARFEEFVTMTEKLCHKNRMKIAHKALLEEERRRVRGEYRDGPTPPPEDAFQETKVAAAPGASGNDGRIDSATSRGRLPDNAKDDANDDEALRRSALARLAALREEEMAESIAAAVAATADGVPAAAEPPAVAARAGSDEFGRLREAPLPQRDIAPVRSWSEKGKQPIRDIERWRGEPAVQETYLVGVRVEGNEYQEPDVPNRDQENLSSALTHPSANHEPMTGPKVRMDNDEPSAEELEALAAAMDEDFGDGW